MRHRQALKRRYGHSSVKLHRVGGAQAEGAKRLGLIKVTRASAKELFDYGVPVIMVGSNVNDYHFFDNWHLAYEVDPRRVESQGSSFDVVANSFGAHLEPELGRHTAFFVRRSKLPASFATRRNS